MWVTFTQRESEDSGKVGKTSCSDLFNPVLKVQQNVVLFWAPLSQRHGRIHPVLDGTEARFRFLRPREE